MQSIQTWCGIDVSAKTLVACRSRQGKEEECLFENDAAGHLKLVQWLGRKARVVIEATGVYHLQLALALDASGVDVMIINPRVAKDFAKALSNRSKTDKIDARALLEYVRRMEFQKWQPPKRAVLELRELARRLTQLIKIAVDEKNRLHSQKVVAISKTVLTDMNEHIAVLEQKIHHIQKAAVQLIRAEENLAKQFDLLRAGPGIGVRSAILLLAELAVLDPTMTTREIVAHAGLDPRSYESGTSVQGPPRISKVGNARIRAILYMNALTAIRHDRGAKLFYARLLARGKKPMQALVAVMRKLLHGVWIVLQRLVRFDSTVLFAASLAKAESSDSAVAATMPELSQDHPKDRSVAEELREQLDPESAEATPPPPPLSSRVA